MKQGIRVRNCSRVCYTESNAEIANKLVISEKTVKEHVSNILGKMHMLDRTQVAVFAWQQGLVSRREP